MPSKEILPMPPDICQNVINIYQKRRKITKKAQIICVYHFFTNFVAELRKTCYSLIVVRYD